jgi:hypothetical protein
VDGTDQEIALVTLDQALAGERLVVSSRPQETRDVTVASLRSDVDKDIPTGLKPDAILKATEEAA